MGPGSNPESRKSWEHFLMFAQLFYKHTEDHQDFINSFVNELSSHLKTVQDKERLILKMAKLVMMILMMNYPKLILTHN